LARALNVDPQNIVNWRKRGTIPAEKIYKFSMEKNLSFDWLFTGQESHAGGIENTAAEADWQMKAIMQQLSKRMDEMQILVNRVMDVVSRDKDEMGKMWGVLNTKDASLATVNASIKDITVRLLDIREDMNRAADGKDVRLLKKVAGD
jgi:hypothetical protein